MDLPVGLVVATVRPGEDADVADAFRVVETYDTRVAGSTRSSLAAIRATLTGPDAHPALHRLVRDGAEPVGLLMVELDRHGREVFLDSFGLGPECDRIQRSLLEFGLESAREVAAADPGSPDPSVDPFSLSADRWQVVSSLHADDTRLAATLDGLGFRLIRRFWRMIQEIDTAEVVEPQAPPGVVRRVVEGPDDRRLLHALFMESFAEHFGSSHDRPFDEWIAVVESLPGADPGRWWLAELDGDPVGVCILDDSYIESNECYVRTLGVVPSARGRGIARWLLECARADSARRGHTGVALSVDGDNTTGATALYESVGYRTREITDVWCLPLE